MENKLMIEKIQERRTNYSLVSWWGEVNGLYDSVGSYGDIEKFLLSGDTNVQILTAHCIVPIVADVLTVDERSRAISTLQKLLTNHYMCDISPTGPQSDEEDTITVSQAARSALDSLEKDIEKGISLIEGHYFDTSSCFYLEGGFGIISTQGSTDTGEEQHREHNQYFIKFQDGAVIKAALKSKKSAELNYDCVRVYAGKSHDQYHPHFDFERKSVQQGRLEGELYYSGKILRVNAARFIPLGVSKTWEWYSPGFEKCSDEIKQLVDKVLG